MDQFDGFHSEWNLGSPGGWDYQRITQEIGKAVWERLLPTPVDGITLDFDHPMFYPVVGVAELLLTAHRRRDGQNPGLIAVVAEEETLVDVVENRNLARRLDAIDGIDGALMAPQHLERSNGRVCYQGRPVSVIFMDFNTDVLLALHRKHDLSPMLQAVREGRVINPRGTEPINVKSMFEVITDPATRDRFHPETVARTPWTRRFFPRSTTGPEGEAIHDLVEWTRRHWDRLVLKPERGYSGKGVRVGGVHPDADDAVSAALDAGDYIVQEKVDFSLWGETLPQLDLEAREVETVTYQTDFRCLFGANGLMGFLGRYGDVPTNVGSGGGVQPLAVLRSDTSVGEATDRLNQAIAAADYEHVFEAVQFQKSLALENQFTYLLGPIKIALRPRLLTPGQMRSLATYSDNIWRDCLTLERMWTDGELDSMINIEPEELEIARSQPWRGAPAIFAADGLFGFGAKPS